MKHLSGGKKPTPTPHNNFRLRNETRVAKICVSIAKCGRRFFASFQSSILYDNFLIKSHHSKTFLLREESISRDQYCSWTHSTDPPPLHKQRNSCVFIPFASLPLWLAQNRYSRFTVAYPLYKRRAFFLNNIL